MNTNPYKAPDAEVADRDIGDNRDVTWARATKVWWSIMWRGILFGGLAGALGGFLVGLIGGVTDANPRLLSSLGSLVGLVAAVPVGIWVKRNVLRKSWSDFRIALITKVHESA